jgi:hypothetical protein
MYPCGTPVRCASALLVSFAFRLAAASERASSVIVREC